MEMIDKVMLGLCVASIVGLGILVGRPKPKAFVYGDKARVIEGFYAGCYGGVVNYDKAFDHYTLSLDSCPKVKITSMMRDFGRYQLEGIDE